MLALLDADLHELVATGDEPLRRVELDGLDREVLEREVAALDEEAEEDGDG